jgi:hypothetical protein
MTVETLNKKVKFLVDDKGRKTHALVPIREYEELFEDIVDAAVVVERRKEGSISIAEMKKRLYGSEKVPG